MCKMMEYHVGDIIEMKKTHPCGNKQWEIRRVGVDFKFRCLGCDHQLIVSREKALKMIKRKKSSMES